MSYAVILKCDNASCTNSVVIMKDKLTIEQVAGALVEALPKDYRYVSVDFGNVGGKASGHVCSMECAMIWHTRRMNETRFNLTQVAGEAYFDADSLPK